MKIKERIKERIEINKIKSMYKNNKNWNVEIKGNNLIVRNW